MVVYTSRAGLKREELIKLKSLREIQVQSFKQNFREEVRNKTADTLTGGTLFLFLTRVIAVHSAACRSERFPLLPRVGHE